MRCAICKRESEQLVCNSWRCQAHARRFKEARAAAEARMWREHTERVEAERRAMNAEWKKRGERRTEPREGFNAAADELLARFK